MPHFHMDEEEDSGFRCQSDDDDSLDTRRGEYDEDTIGESRCTLLVYMYTSILVYKY